MSDVLEASVCTEAFAAIGIGIATASDERKVLRFGILPSWPVASALYRQHHVILMLSPCKISNVRFCNFELDDQNGELRRDGVLVKLAPRQFRLLHLLARNAGRVVTRDEIQREIWGADTFVDFQRNLNVCVAQLRATLEDDSESPRYIETVPRRGYRFVAETFVAETSVAPLTLAPTVVPQKRFSWRAIGALV